MKLFLAFYFSFFSLLAFCLTAFDKDRAKKGGRRVRERTLLLLAFWGGALGELLAMGIFRHKIRKPKFYLLVPLFLLLHGGFIICWEAFYLEIPIPFI